MQEKYSFEAACKLIVQASSSFDMEEKVELCHMLSAELDPHAALNLRLGLLAPMGVDQLKLMADELSSDEAGTMWCVNMRAVLEANLDLYSVPLQAKGWGGRSLTLP